MKITQEKQHGRTYTPQEVANFLSKQLCSALTSDKETPVSIFDPSCGDGALLIALIHSLHQGGYRKISVCGIDNQKSAIESAQKSIKTHFEDLMHVDLRVQNYADFIEPYLNGKAGLLFDIVITNPPYVRTQYQGSLPAVRSLMLKRGIKGDLFLLFLNTLEHVLKPSAFMGAIVSNKILQTKECKETRKNLLRAYQIRHIWDLGDTKVFQAHVLPLLLLLSKKDEKSADTPCSPSKMTTIYEAPCVPGSHVSFSLSKALRASGRLKIKERFFDVNQGILNTKRGIWTIENERIRRWCTQVEQNSQYCLKDIGVVRNGLKTTANKVFIAPGETVIWDDVPFSSLELSYPIFLSKDATQYGTGEPSAFVLYPHGEDGSVLPLDSYPLSKKYLLEHYETLSSRSYIQDKRLWYKHHVPQSWKVFRKPKLIWKEISHAPQVWLDTKGFLIDGPLFFLVLGDISQYSDWSEWDFLRFLLAYLNSSFIGVYLRVYSNEKLYSNKMRCNKKNMECLPLPNLKGVCIKELLGWVDELREQVVLGNQEKIDAFFWKAFGFSEYTNPLDCSS